MMDKEFALPTRAQLEAELSREKTKHSFSRNFKNTIFILVVVAAIVVLIATLLLPVLQIYGSSMEPTLERDQVVVAIKTSKLKTGDVVAFYFNNKILVKRVIGTSGDWIDIDEDGNVYVNDEMLDEPYLKEKAFGDCNITLPYQVPESKVFLMGDNREISIDSRNRAVGCIENDQIVGKLLFRIWPLSGAGSLR